LFIRYTSICSVPCDPSKAKAKDILLEAFFIEQATVIMIVTRSWLECLPCTNTLAYFSEEIQLFKEEEENKTFLASKGTKMSKLVI
jgi:hypothetical protein